MIISRSCPRATIFSKISRMESKLSFLISIYRNPWICAIDHGKDSNALIHKACSGKMEDY